MIHVFQALVYGVDVVVEVQKVQRAYVKSKLPTSRYMRTVF